MNAFIHLFNNLPLSQPKTLYIGLLISILSVQQPCEDRLKVYY